MMHSDKYEQGEARPSVSGFGSYILTDCKNWWFSACNNPMRRDHCLCPKCGKVVLVNMTLFNEIEQYKAGGKDSDNNNQ